jgi:hypothetical protein
MKKQALKGISMLVLIISIAFVTAVVSANAQTHDRLKADVPFDFMVGDQKLPAGAYTISPLMEQSNDGVVLRNDDSSASAMHLTNRIDGKAEQQARLVFRKQGDSYYLSEIWDGNSEGRQVRLSRKAREAELAKANSGSETIAVAARQR